MKKSYKNILVYDISYKTLIGAKPLRIKFDKINGLKVVLLMLYLIIKQKLKLINKILYF